MVTPSASNFRRDFLACLLHHVLKQLDIIFVIYLYQRWIYPVDKSRVNEFGQGGEAAKEEKPSITTPTTTVEPIKDEKAVKKRKVKKEKKEKANVNEE